MTETQARAAGLTEEQISQMTLDSGAHESPEGGHCLLEVVSMFAGEDFGDHPKCVDYVLAEFGRTWNDGMRSNKEREQLKVYIPLLVGTAQGEALSQRRAFMAVDWTIRVNTPAWLDLSPALSEYAAELRALDPITGEDELARAQPALERAQRAANAAWDAARDAAWDAARDAARAAAWDAAWAAAWAAARDAAWDAARAAARDAAWDAARAAAWAAAWAAARDAAWAAAKDAVGYDAQYKIAYDTVAQFLEPTTKRMQEDAHALYLRMINERLADAAVLDHAEAEGV